MQICARSLLQEANEEEWLRGRAFKATQKLATDCVSIPTPDIYEAYGYNLGELRLRKNGKVPTRLSRFAAQSSHSSLSFSFVPSPILAHIFSRPNGQSSETILLRGQKDKP